MLGGNTAALVCALRKSSEGKNVLLVHEGTSLFSEITDAADYRAPKIADGEWKAVLFPDEVYETKRERLHPDRLKRHAEALLEKNGIRLLYSCQAVNPRRNGCLIAHKSGIYELICGEIYDLRKLPYRAPDSYLLHYLDGQHRALHLLTRHTGDDARSLFARYEDALQTIAAAFKSGWLLARSGASATTSGVVDIDAAIQFAANCSPVACTEKEALYDGGDYDVIVAGGGTAGASAAAFCARQGLKTLLLEMNRILGGTATAGGVSTYWFGLRCGAAKQIDAAVAEYRNALHLPPKRGLWNDDDGFYPDLKAHVLLKLCLEAGADVQLGCVVCGAAKEEGCVNGVYYAQDGMLKTARARFTIDCTGDGDVCVLAGADHTYGSETDGMTYWASLAQYPKPDSYRNNFSTMVNVGDLFDYTRFIVAGRKLGGELYDHGSYVAVRESRHIRGCETVTLRDLLLMKNVDDPLYACFSNYDPKGRLTSELCYIGLLPPNQLFVIPRGACVPSDKDGKPIDGLLIGGKAVSCTHDAFPGIRMQSDLERQGLALAALAGQAIRQNTDALSCTGIRERILSLGGDFTMPENKPMPPLKETVASLRGDEAWEWLETPVTACADMVSPIIQILCADSTEAVPLLLDRFNESDDGALKLTLSRLMLYHGCEAGAGTVIRAVRAALEACPDGLPERKGSLNYGQMLPDHGLMPEPVYLINALAYCPKTDIEPLMKQAYDRIKKIHRDWYSLRAGIYCWLEAFPFVAARRRDRKLVPYLKGILTFPEFLSENADRLLSERLHMLRITLFSALHSLGENDGTRGLEAYLSDPRASFRIAARMLTVRSSFDNK